MQVLAFVFAPTLHTGTQQIKDANHVSSDAQLAIQYQQTVHHAHLLQIEPIGISNVTVIIIFMMMVQMQLV